MKCSCTILKLPSLTSSSPSSWRTGLPPAARLAGDAGVSEGLRQNALEPRQPRDGRPRDRRPADTHHACAGTSVQSRRAFRSADAAGWLPTAMTRPRPSVRALPAPAPSHPENILNCMSRKGAKRNFKHARKTKKKEEEKKARKKKCRPASKVVSL